jgi:hypothetical protein
MQLHQLLQVTKSQVSLLGEGVVTSLAEIFGAELDLADMFLSVKILADIHNSVQVMAFTEDINGILMLTSLDIEVSGFFPVVAISFEFCLLYQNCRV